jgi:hypothetical protein
MVHKITNTHAFSTSNVRAGSSELKQILTPALFRDVHKLWFGHCDEESLVLPGWNEMGKWFTRDEAFDKLCV